MNALNFLQIFVLDRSLALRFKSRNGLPRIRTALNGSTMRSASYEPSRFVFSRFRRVHERFEFLRILAYRLELQPAHVYEVRPRKDRRGFDLISEGLPFGRLWYAEPNGWP